MDHQLNVVEPIRDYLRSLVHLSAQADLLTAARHQAFIGPRLAGGLLAVALLPGQLALGGIPTPFETVLLAWIIVPSAAVYYVVRTGQLANAYLYGSLAITLVAAATATLTQGLTSAAAACLLFLPLEAALSGSRKAVLGAGGMVIGAAGFVLMLEACGLAPAALVWGESSAPAILLGALAYGITLAIAALRPSQLAEELLQSEQARAGVLTEQMTDVILLHGADGTVNTVTPSCERVLGVEPEALEGERFFGRIHVLDRPFYLKALSDAAHQGRGEVLQLRVQRSKLNSHVPNFVCLEMRCRRVSSASPESGRGPTVVSVLHDLSELKEREHAALMARTEAENVKRAKELLLSTMSHELRTPVNAIIGFSDLLLQRHEAEVEGARRREYTQLINDCGQHMLAVVDSLLEMSRMGTGQFPIAPEPLALAPMIAGCCELLAPKAQASGIQLLFGGATPCPEILADKRAIKQVLLNLVTNALKFTRRGGEVTVSAIQEHSSALIMVADTGVGIPEPDLARLGVPFFQVQSTRPREGAGLGLAIVKSLISLHGGTIDITSRLGHGTRVAVRLPAAGMPAVVPGVRAEMFQHRERVTQMPDARAKKSA